MKTWVITLLLVATGAVGMIFLVDYFADGCIVDYDHVVSRKVGNLMVYSHPAQCHQMIFHTARGREREKQNL